MTFQRWRKKPVVIEAVQWTSEAQAHEIAEWIGEAGEYDPDFFGGYGLQAEDWGCLEIETLEGTMTVAPYDYVIRGVAGEFYPCKPDIFAHTYEPAECAERGQ